MLRTVFERFVQKAPVAVMVRGMLDRILGDEALNGLFEQAAGRQYTRQLLFTGVFELMSLVVCKVYASIHAAYQEHKETIGASVTAVYDKLNGIDASPRSQPFSRLYCEIIEGRVATLKRMGDHCGNNCFDFAYVEVI